MSEWLVMACNIAAKKAFVYKALRHIVRTFR